MLFFVLCANVLIEEKKAGICSIHIQLFDLVFFLIMEDIQKTQNDESSSEDWSKEKFLLKIFSLSWNFF